MVKLFYVIFTCGFFYYVCMSDANSKKNVGDCFHVVLSILNLIYIIIFLLQTRSILPVKRQIPITFCAFKTTFFMIHITFFS